jgi:hypothetical protein
VSLLSITVTKYLRQLNLIRERAYFGLQFRRFQSMVAWRSCFEPVIVQYIMAGACGGGSLLNLWRAGSKVKERKG